MNLNTAIKVTANGYSFLHFFNKSEVYSLKGFNTENKARNYAKKYGYTVHDAIPANVRWNIL